MAKKFFSFVNAPLMAQADAVEDAALDMGRTAQAVQKMAAKGCENADEVYQIGRELEALARKQAALARRMAEAARGEAVA